MAQQQQQQQQVQRTNLNDYGIAACGKHVTVYCWSSTEAGSERWVQAETLGRMLGERGFGVVTGGYCGSMEAVSKGAREATSAPEAKTIGKPAPQPASVQAEPADNGVDVRGILVPGQFPDRVLVGNRYLTQSHDARNMLDRLDTLSALTRYYVALPGTLGTLTEIAIIWSLSVLHKAGEERPLILLFRDPWEKAMVDMGRALQLPEAHMAALQYVDTVEECVERINADYEAAVARQAA